MKKKLTDAEALAIYHSNDSRAVLSAVYGICQATVSSIRSGKLYRSVTGGVSRGCVRAPYRITKYRASFIRACHANGQSLEAIADRLQLPLNLVQHHIESEAT